MSWRLAGRRDLPAVLDFLLRDESLSVPFTSRLRAGAHGCTVLLDADEAGTVTECALLTAGGLLLPVLSAGAAPHAELARLLLGLRAMVHSIMGVGRSVAVAETLIPLPPEARVEYFLMTLDRSALRPALAPACAGVETRFADASDAEELFPLQRGYELEEVVLSPSHFNDVQCMKLLRTSLREQLVCVAERDGTAVAKAATNARGFTVDQVGGVYTVPHERGRGLGKVVMGSLLKAIFAEKQGACLFVKKRNRPALALYERLGFTPVTDYFISYYGV
jgi:predicted GNAT family acetyltransferase